MVFWSIQDKKVLDIVLNDGIYRPDFSKSQYLKARPQLQPLYDMVLDSFNTHNGVQLSGLVFAFLKSDGEVISSFEDMTDLLIQIDTKQDVVAGLLKTLMRGEPMLLELAYSDQLNPICIDINDFQFLMPPVTILPPYTEASIDRITQDIQLGQIRPSEFASGLIQAHLPYINRNTLLSAAPLDAFRDRWG